MCHWQLGVGISQRRFSGFRLLLQRAGASLKSMNVQTSACNFLENRLPQKPMIVIRYTLSAPLMHCTTAYTTQTTLTYDCVCGNGQSPNASEYSQTLPYFICTEWGTQCVAACAGDTSCQSACRDDHPCGAQNPKRVNVTSTTSSVSSTTLPADATSGTAGIVYSGIGVSTTATAASSSNTKSGSEAILDLGRSYSLAVIMVGIFTGFALIV